MKTCEIEGCEKPGRMKGTGRHCAMHASRIYHHGDPHHERKSRYGDPVTRFWSKVDRRGDDECWPWIGAIQTKGYGQFVVGKKRILAHRYAYELIVGPIPAGLELDHVSEWGCTMRHCVNPAHLEPATHAENVRRSTRHRPAKIGATA